MATSKDERRTALMSLAARRHNRPTFSGSFRSSKDVEWRRTVAPGVEDVLDTSSHLCARRFALGAGHEKVVVVSVDMPDGGRDGESDGLGFQCAPGGASPDAATAACRCVKRDRVGSQGRTTRELLANRRGELVAEAYVLVGSTNLIAFPAAGAHVGVGEALLRGLFDRRGLGQNALSLIAFTPHAPAHDDGGQSAGLLRAPGQGCVSGGQELEVAKVGAVEAERTGLVLEQKITGGAARRARPRAMSRDDDDVSGRPAWARDHGLRQFGRRPMGAVGALGVGVGASGELQLSVFDLRRRESMVFGPALQRRQRGRDLRSVNLHAPVERGNATPLPPVDVRLR